MEHKEILKKEYGLAYDVRSRKSFSPIKIDINQYVNDCIKWAMHPDQYFSPKKRSIEQIKQNSIQGKIGEFGVYEFLKTLGHNLDKPELKIRSKGNYDSYDLLLDEEKIQIKTGSHKANIFFLQKDDWDNDGNYKYIKESDENKSPYKYFIFGRLKPSIKEALPIDQIYTEEKIIETLSQINFRMDIPGFITLDDFKKAIMEEKYLKSGCRINREFGFNLSSDNYYFESCDLRDTHTFPIKKP